MDSHRQIIQTTSEFRHGWIVNRIELTCLPTRSAIAILSSPEAFLISRQADSILTSCRMQSRIRPVEQNHILFGRVIWHQNLGVVCHVMFGSSTKHGPQLEQNKFDFYWCELKLYSTSVWYRYHVLNFPNICFGPTGHTVARPVWTRLTSKCHIHQPLACHRKACRNPSRIHGTGISNHMTWMAQFYGKCR